MQIFAAIIDLVNSDRGKEIMKRWFLYLLVGSIIIAIILEFFRDKYYI